MKSGAFIARAACASVLLFSISWCSEIAYWLLHAVGEGGPAVRTWAVVGSLGPFVQGILLWRSGDRPRDNVALAAVSVGALLLAIGTLRLAKNGGLIPDWGRHDISDAPTDLVVYYATAIVAMTSSFVLGHAARGAAVALGRGMRAGQSAKIERR